MENKIERIAAGALLAVAILFYDVNMKALEKGIVRQNTRYAEGCVRFQVMKLVIAGVEFDHIVIDGERYSVTFSTFNSPGATYSLPVREPVRV
jgi:hypothetical protein